MFRNHTDLVRTPVVTEKNKKDVRSDEPTSDGCKCDICGSVWLTETDVDIHRKKMHAAELISMIRAQKNHFCLTCVRDQGSAENLLRHIKTDHLLSSPTALRVEREIFICDYCENVFFNKKLLVSHIQYIHRNTTANEITISCPKCPKSFRGKKIWFHFIFHQFNISSTCQICLTCFKSKKELMDHLKTHQSYLYCNICSYSSNREKFFNEHNELHKRRSPRPFRGSMRPYFAPWSPVTPWKYRIETGIKGLQLFNVSVCVLCREICSSAEEKRKHITIDHSNETYVKQKPMCVCGEEFFNMVLLKHHIFKMKGNHRLLEEDEMPTGSGESKKDIVDSLDLECEYITLQDLGSIEEVIVNH